MNIVKVLFACLICYFLVILALWFGEKPEYPTGVPHPKYNHILNGGGSISSTGYTTIFGYLFGLCTALTLCIFIMVGSVKNDRIGTIKNYLIFGTVAYIIVYTLTYFSYIDYTTTEHTEFFLGWPKPTAWMIFGMWSTPIIFVFIYIFRFREWILSEEEEKRFNELVAQRRQRNQ